MQSMPLPGKPGQGAGIGRGPQDMMGDGLASTARAGGTEADGASGKAPVHRRNATYGGPVQVRDSFEACVAL